MTGRVLARKVGRDLRAQRAQSLALGGVVALGITTFVALVGAYLDLSGSLDRTTEALRMPDAWVSLADGPASVADEAAAVPGVAAAEARLVVDTGLQLDGGGQARARVVSLPDGRRPVLGEVFVDDGDRAGPGVLLEADFAAARGVRPGDTISLLVGGAPVPQRVAALVTSAEYLMPVPSRYELLPSPSTFAVVFMPLGQAQALFDRPGRVNDVALRVAPAARPAAVAAAVAARLAPYSPSPPVLRRDQASYAAVKQDLSAFRSVAIAIPGIILLAAALSVAAMLGRLVRSQQQHVGLMKALGYRDRAVAGHYVGLALAVTLAGAAVGVAAGSWLARVVITGYLDQMGLPFAQNRFHPGVAAAGMALTIGLGTLAALGPARRAAAMAPASAMRLDPLASTAAGGTPLGGLGRLPLTWRIPLRDLVRARRRTVSTGLGVVSSIVLLLMVFGLRDGITQLVDSVFVDVERWDLSATFSEPQPRALATEVAGWEGVSVVSPFAQLPVSVVGPKGRETVLLTAVEPAQRMHVLQLPEGTTATRALAPGGVVLGPAVARQVGVERGDTVTLRSPLGSRRGRFTATSDEFIPAVAYVSLDEVRRAAGVDVINGLYLTVEPGQATAVQARLYRLPGAAGVKQLSEQENDLRSQLGLFDAMIGVILLFALAMAFALLFNAMTISVLERQREYATMRAVGGSRRLVAALFATESTALWALSLVPGAVLGTWVAKRLADAVAAGFFSLPVRISPLSYALTGLGVLATMLLAAVPAVRRVNRLDLASATKVLA